MKEQKSSKRDGDSKRRRKPGKRADWSEANAELIYYLIIAVGKWGGAIRFGSTSDGGAFAIGVYGDGDPWTDYLPGNQDINARLRSLTDELTD